MSSSKILEDIVISATGTKAHFDVWWAQVSEAKPRYVPIMNNHSDFFLASQDAHYKAFFIYLAHLFDKRSDVSSIPKYLELIKAETDPERFQQLETDYNALIVRATPLVKIRHKRVAHVDAKLSETDVFTEISLTWNEVRKIIYDVASFVDSFVVVSSGSGKRGIPRDGRLSEATLSLFEALDRDE